MELKNGKKIEFDLEEFIPLLLSNKQEGFRLIGERFLNAVMNQEFCLKHYFEAVDHGDTIIIHRTLRPNDDVDDELIDLEEILSKKAVDIHFDPDAQP
jgi:hypothetical protein